MPAIAGISTPNKRKANKTSFRPGCDPGPLRGAAANQKGMAEWRESISAYCRERVPREKVFELLDAMHAAGLQGNVPAAMLWLDRVLGKVESKLDVSVTRKLEPDQLREAIETLTRLGLADRLPPSLVVAESPALPVASECDSGPTMPQDQSESGPPSDTTRTKRIDPEPS